MAGSTESRKRMGDMVSAVNPDPHCPKGYTGTPPDCKKIEFGDINFDNIFENKETNITTSEKPTTLPFDPNTNIDQYPIKGKLYKPGDNKLELH